MQSNLNYIFFILSNFALSATETELTVFFDMLVQSHIHTRTLFI